MQVFKGQLLSVLFWFCVHLLNDVFTGCRIQAWLLFFQMTVYCFSGFYFCSDGKSTNIFTFVLLYHCPFPPSLAAFRMSLSTILFLFIWLSVYLDSWIYGFVSFMNFGNSLSLPLQIFLFAPASPQFLDSSYLYARLLDIVLQVSGLLCSIFLSHNFIYSSVWIISIDLSWGSLVLFPVIYVCSELIQCIVHFRHYNFLESSF